MLVRHKSLGKTEERKLAVISTGPAAKVKLEYCESYVTVKGFAGRRLGSLGSVVEPVPRYSYEIPSTVTIYNRGQQCVGLNGQ